MYINAYFLTKFFKKHAFQAFPNGRLENHTKVLNSAHASGFMKLHMDLVVLVKKNVTHYFSVPKYQYSVSPYLSKICPNFTGHA